MPDRYIYLDHSASTPVDPRVLEAMLPYFSEQYGNPASMHHFARQTEKAVEQSRQKVAEILNCQPKEIVFTGCGSESDNLAIRGVAYRAVAEGKQPHLLTSPLEHSAVGRTVKATADLLHGEATYLHMESDGSLKPETLDAALREKPGTLVALMYANNEIGTILPIAELAEVAHQHGALFHTDAVQAGGQMPLDVKALKVDMMAISAHKFYGPKGVGALYVRDGIELMASQSGGSHEEGRRAGTLNVPLIVGLAKALELAYAERDQHIAHFTHMRDRLIEGLLAVVPEAELTGSREKRLPSHASFAFKHVDGNMLLMYLDNKGIAASSGSACKTGNPKPSELLMSLGYDASWALGGLRLSVGRQTTDADIDTVLDVLPKEIEKVRNFTAVTMG